MYTNSYPLSFTNAFCSRMGGNTAKTTILDGSRGSSQADAIAQLLGGGSTFAGSDNKFGYALPSTNNHPSVINLSQLLGGGPTYAGSTNQFGNAFSSSSNQPRVINLSQLQGVDSNIINTLASALGNGGQTKIVILGNGQNPGGSMSANPPVIRLNSLPGSGVMSQSNLMGSGGLNFGGINDFGGLNGGMNFGDLGLGSSSSSVFQLPQNAYSDKSRKNISTGHHRGHNVRGGNGHSPQNGGNGHSPQNGGSGHSLQNGGNSKQPMNNGQRPMRDNYRNAPLNIKFTYRP